MLAGDGMRVDTMGDVVDSAAQRSEGSSSGTASRIVDALVAGGVGLAVHLPDSVMYDTVRLIESDGRIPTVLCSREDEGVAIAAGASLAGSLPVVLMEGSGLGYS